MSFKISIQNPFEQHERITENANASKASQLFEEIDWASIEKEMYPREDEVIHYLYYYEIASEAYGTKRTLTITPDFDAPNEASIFIIRYEYPDTAKPGKYLDYEIHNSHYAFAKDCIAAFTTNNQQFFIEHFEVPGAQNRNSGGCFKKVFIGFFVCGIALIAFTHFVIGWNHVPTHLASLKAYIFPSESNAVDDVNEPGVDTAANIDYATVAPQALLDTIYWKRQIEKGEFVPEEVRTEYEAALKYDFSQLQTADERPNSEEAESAILYRYKEDVKQLLERDNAHIRIGKCYKAELQNGANGEETARVSAMICAFDKKGNNLGNIQMPLLIAYDFVQYASDPDTWYITDLSQTIPYDYELNENKY